MVTVCRLEADFLFGLGATIAIAHSVSSQLYCCIDRDAKVLEVVVVGLDQQDMAVRANSTHHIEVQRDLRGPTGIGGWIVTLLALLIHFLEAAIAGSACGKAESRTVDAKIGLSIRIIESIDNANRLSIAL